MEDRSTLQFNQEQNEFPIGSVGRFTPTGKLDVKDETTLRVETFDEWRSAFATALLISMISGLVSSALMKQEV